MEKEDLIALVIAGIIILVCLFGAWKIVTYPSKFERVIELCYKYKRDTCDFKES